MPVFLKLSGFRGLFGLLRPELLHQVLRRR